MKKNTVCPDSQHMTI